MYRHKKKNIFLIGPMGSGKSTIGLCLAKSLKYLFYDSDVEISKKTGMSIENLFNLEGEYNFRLHEEQMIKKLTKKKNIVLATGGGSIISEKSRNCLISRGIIIYLRITIDEQLIRTSLNTTRPLLSNNISNNKKILMNLSKIRDPLYHKIADFSIDTHNKKIDVIQMDILHNISKFCHSN
ncbi:shikimate kinase AroK [Buchnera aphidicola]|uniref:Shikimate kinase 1 n=1 Tax=Buchnera aphidicola (Cinara strobi) TaxID=1921549 RepID=A0A3B1DME0_9GAMM|nr:shikimate kinase AroK [Buchnera aphidicola]VAX76851.1 Shikimate kinase 1 [Buchnera aphidicola (Cinara strobi)]